MSFEGAIFSESSSSSSYSPVIFIKNYFDLWQSQGSFCFSALNLLIFNIYAYLMEWWYLVFQITVILFTMYVLYNMARSVRNALKERFRKRDFFLLDKIGGGGASARFNKTVQSSKQSQVFLDFLPENVTPLDADAAHTDSSSPPAPKPLSPDAPPATADVEKKD